MPTRVSITFLSRVIGTKDNAHDGRHAFVIFDPNYHCIMDIIYGEHQFEQRLSTSTWFVYFLQTEGCDMNLAITMLMCV